MQALADVDLTVRRGNIAGIIGPNGAGKTSLLNCIAGFYRPQHGRIVFEGRDVTRVPAARRPALGLARTFQDIALFEGMTVLDNIKLGAHCHLESGVLDDNEVTATMKVRRATIEKKLGPLIREIYGAPR